MSKPTELDLAVIEALKETMKAAQQQIEDIKLMQQALLKIINIQKDHEKKIDILASNLYEIRFHSPNQNN